MNNARDVQVEEALEQRASEWFVRHREGELSSAEQRQFMAWLRASPRHVAAYLQLIGLTSELPEAMDGMADEVEALAMRVRHSPRGAEQALFVRGGTAPRRTRRVSQRWAWAATVLMLLAGAVYLGVEYRADTYSTVVAAERQRLLALPDGSSAHLNADTRLVIRYSDTQRLLELSEGQALFDVVRDPRRPFIVRSGSTDVVAIGTRFDVYRRAQRMQVTVVDGRIEIIRDPASGVPPLPVGAGEQVRIEDDGLPVRAVPVDAQLATAWSRRAVNFAGERLADVAEQFARSTGARIDIADEQLRDYRVSGVFQAYDLDSFIAYLEEFDQVVVERDGQNIRVTVPETKNR